MPLLDRQMLDILGIQDADKIVPTEKDMKPTDPVSENMDIINGKPLKAFIYQDHEAHIQTHMSLTENPQVMEIMGKSPNAKKAMAEMSAHVQEHLAFKYRQDIEKELGVELPNPNESLPEDIEYRISRLVAPAAAQITGKAAKEQQAQEAQKQAQDPIVQMRQQELQIKQQEVQQRAQAEMAKIQLDMQKLAMKSEIDKERLDQQERLETAKLGAKIAETNSKKELESARIAVEDQIAGAKLGVQVAKDIMGNK